MISTLALAASLSLAQLSPPPAYSQEIPADEAPPPPPVEEPDFMEPRQPQPLPRQVASDRDDDLIPRESVSVLEPELKDHEDEKGRAKRP